MPWTEQELAEMRAFDAELDEQEAAGELVLTDGERQFSIALDREARKANPKAARNTSRRAYYEQNREYELARQRRYYQQHREEILARKKKQRQDDPEGVRGYYRAYRREYYQRNKERLLAQNRERRAKKAREAGGEGKEYESESTVSGVQ